MTTLTEFLVEDHACCDQLLRSAIGAAGAGQWDTVRSATLAFADSLERHLRLEERVVFPAFERRFSYAVLPTVDLRSEHLRIRAVVQRLCDAAAGADYENFLAHAGTLLLAMHQHSEKEEGMLYPMIERSMGQAAHDLVDLMRRFGMDDDDLDEADCEASCQAALA